MHPPRSFVVRTIGCQMNAHDSERMSGQMLDAGYMACSDIGSADVIIINTCAVRENADNRLYGNLGQLRPLKEAKPQLKIVVGGCLAQKDQEEVLRRAPWVDVVFGTHNVGALATLLERATVTGEAQSDFRHQLEDFPSHLPVSRSSPHSAWVAISVGCNNTCSYCIVPSVRGPQRDRSRAEILDEIRALVDAGVVEVTLLGQNVNSYGVDAEGRPAFAELLRECGLVVGLRRVRFASPHPRDFNEDVIGVMAETENVMPNLHLPLQSGSDRILARMRRSYRMGRYLALTDRLRGSIPGLAITTDVIVGFPGESDADFERTLDVVREVRFSGAFTFKYSGRPGTEAAGMTDQVPAAVVGQRYEQLVDLVDEIAWAEGRRKVGSLVEVLVSADAGKKDATTGRISGRAKDNGLVHLGGSTKARPGDLVTTEITGAAPHHLIADAATSTVERTRGGDAWDRSRLQPQPDIGAAEPGRSVIVDLGLPALRGPGLSRSEDVE